MTRRSANSALRCRRSTARKTRKSQADAQDQGQGEERAAQNFEAMFLNSMFQQMFTGIDGEGPFGGSGALKVWRSFLTDQYAKIVRQGRRHRHRQARL